MALNLKTLATRSFTGAVFVMVLLACLLWNYYSFTLLFLVVSLLGLNEFYKLGKALGYAPFRIAGFISAILVYKGFLHFGLLMPGMPIRFNIRSLILLVPFAILAVAVCSGRANAFRNAMYTIGGIIYSVVPFALLHELVTVPGIIHSESLYTPTIVLGIILLIWSNDTFAYLGGSIFGRHKMIERISPGKTWEGTLFGIAVTFGVSFLIRYYLFEPDDGYLWPLLGVLVPVLATLGDLVESLLKREAGVKDTGHLLPGHGGVLDRFDSLIFVSPFVVVLSKLL
jgi:phosphatidate cytidylyltransferase